MTFTECADAVSASHRPEYFPALYDKMVADGSIDSTALLEEDYICEIDSKYRLFNHTLDAVLESARLIKQDQALIRYTNLLSAAMLNREVWSKCGFASVPFVKEGEPARDFVGLIAMFPSMELAYNKMREHNFDDEAIRANFSSFETCIDIHVLRFGWAALNQLYFGWLQRYIDVNIINYGGFNFEMVKSVPPRVIVLKNKISGESVRLMPNIKMHRDGMVLGSADYTDEEGSYIAEFIETDEYFEGYPCGDNGFCTGEKQRYDRTEWEIALRGGDPVLSVHIPRKADLKGKAFIDAYTGALELYKVYYPEFKPKAIYCYSWLMDPRIDEVCGGAPNIVNFQSPFKMFPVHSAGEEVFSFVFIQPFKSYEELPEDTRLMRALKKRYIDGKHLHAFGGVFLI